MNDFKYEVAHGEVTITGYTGAGGDVVVPESIDGIPVTAIGGYAFYSCTGLTGITLPKSITTIGAFAFGYCTGLTSIPLPNSITEKARKKYFQDAIGYGAFWGCSSLTSINLPIHCSIGANAFRGCPNLTITFRKK